MNKADRVVSMTGYGTSKILCGRLHVESEVRSFNSRYLDTTVRVPDDFRVLEPAIRELIASALTRGKVEVRVQVHREEAIAEATLNRTALQKLLAIEAQLRALAPHAAALTCAEILRWPGVVSDSEVSPEVRDREHGAILECVRQSIVLLSESREREGAALARTILDRIAAARAIRERLLPTAQRVRTEYPARLRAKIEAAGIAVDEERLAQEIILYAQRIDIDEELDRLHAHFGEVERVLAKGGDVGKRLDFLMQELNREANTLGSKSVTAETTAAAIDLKVLIEQMREQVQNLQ